MVLGWTDYDHAKVTRLTEKENQLLVAFQEGIYFLSILCCDLGIRHWTQFGAVCVYAPSGSENPCGEKKG